MNVVRVIIFSSLISVCISVALQKLLQHQGKCFTVFLPLPLNEKTVSHLLNVWNIRKVEQALSCMFKNWYATKFCPVPKANHS